jgi:hypothetical protein
MQTKPSSYFEAVRLNAAHAANVEDADLWRWFCAFFEEGRLRWCKSAAGWLISVDHKHLATENNFYDAIRIAKDRFNYGTRRKAGGEPNI